MAAEAADPVHREAESFTPKQGQYLALIYYYAKIHGRTLAEADFQRFFRVTPPVVHQMIKTLAARGFIDREAGTARSIRLPISGAADVMAVSDHGTFVGLTQFPRCCH